MSADSLALLRKNAGQDIRALAEEHFKHDLQDSDRDVLKSAAGKISTHLTVGSILGLGLGVLLAFRLRRTRLQMFEAFRAHEKPTHVKFADGREEAIPDITPFMRPSALGDFAAYTFFGFGGLFLGGETGLLTGASSAGRTITRDPESRQRIETAFRRFRADVLRKEADALDKKRGVTELLGL
ncbi:MAG: hypothetical protein LQ338_008026 [Usnochroma carphineum]|nr:MAG: hypothetical protein LQ338_008026 [Usnochroma carphineum]